MMLVKTENFSKRTQPTKFKNAILVQYCSTVTNFEAWIFKFRSHFYRLMPQWVEDLIFRVLNTPSQVAAARSSRREINRLWQTQWDTPGDLAGADKRRKMEKTKQSHSQMSSWWRTKLAISRPQKA